MALTIFRINCFILCSFILFECVLCINIDTKIPVIKQGPSNSYFGFSVAQHQVTTLSGGQENQLLIGAPLADPTASGQNPGALYRCTATNPSSTDCQSQPQIEANNDNIGSRINQWLGVTVKSMGKNGKVMVCAHRHTINYNGRGTCMIMNKNLQDSEQISPCTDDESIGHAGDGYCQAGTSGLIVEDDKVVIGAPGAVHWTGTLFKLYVGSQLGVSNKIYFTPMWRSQTPPPPVDYNSYLGFSTAAGRFDDDISTIKYVGGAPRSTLTGQVVLFYRDESVTDRDTLNYKPNQILSGEEPFSAFGYEILALDINNDGYDDLIVGSPMYSNLFHNGSRKTGGAIFIYMGGAKKEAINKFSKPQKILSREMSAEECEELNCADARFGSAIANAGDLNLDTYQDVVVGAPYEGMKGAIYIFHGTATGLKDPFAQRIYAEEIDMDLKSFGYAIAGGFDMDFNGYPDILVGAYASDQVVMLRTRPIVNLTSFVIVEPTKFNLTNPQICQYDRSLHYCVRLSICLAYTAKPEDSFREKLEVKFQLEMEKNHFNKRAHFKNKDPMYPNGDIKEDRIFLNMLSHKECWKEIIYLKHNFQNKLSPILISINYSLVNKAWPTRQKTQGITLPNINEYPILVIDQTHNTTVITEVHFTKECGPDDICESRLVLDTFIDLNKDENGVATIILGQNRIISINITLINQGEPAYETYFYLIAQKEFSLRGQYPKEPFGFSPDCETFNVTTIKCTGIDNPFGNEAKSRNIHKFSILLNTDSIPNSPDLFEIKALVNTTNKDLSPVSSTQKMMQYRVVNLANIVVTGTAHPSSDVVYSGTPIVESAISTEDQIGPAINHTYQVLNYGPAPVNASTLTIFWPYGLSSPYKNGTQLLYLMQFELVSGPPGSVCRHNPSMLNVIQAKSLGPYYNQARQQRDKEFTLATTIEPNDVSEPEQKLEYKQDNQKPHTSEHKPKKEYIKLDCKGGRAKCHRIICDIGQLNKHTVATILVRARLWKSTLLEEFPNAAEVAIRSYGSVSINPALNIKQLKPAYLEHHATTYAVPEPKELPQSKISWWIVFLAAIGGIVILLILIFIFSMLGFFKRKRPPVYESRN